MTTKRFVFFCLLSFAVFVSCHRDVNSLYNEAIEIRYQFGVERNALKRASTLLMKAAGVTYDQLRHPSSLPLNITIHSGVLRELALALEVGGIGVPRNELLSFQWMRRAAELGDAKAHGEMSTRFAFGFADESSYKFSKLFNFSQGDPVSSLLHATFGAFGNDSVSQMILGYRHMIGHGVPRNCPTAVAYYNAVAEKVIDSARFPGALPLIDKTRLGLRSHHRQKKVKVEQWLQYYQYTADQGDVDAQTTVGRLLNFGSHGIKRDFSQAFYYFKQAAESGDAKAMGHLGHMYANGQGVNRNNETALDWFMKAADLEDANGYYGLGYMYLSGYGVKKDLNRAYFYFNKAAASEHTEAQFSLGVMHLKGWGTRTSPIRAMAFFTAASHGGHLLAMYNLAMMHISGTGTEPNCHAAVALLKQVAESGPWCLILQDAHNSFESGDYTRALTSYLKAAQMGLELGQSNAAWMLEHGFGPGHLPQSVHMALGLYKWSAEQENTNSLLAVGDIFFYGRGIQKDWNRSSGVYQLAEKQKSSRAAFNLGFMHQYGAGVPKDPHLAKRYYDLAYAYNKDSFYACKLALVYLRMQSWWELIRPNISPALHPLVDRLFTCKYENDTHVPSGWWTRRREGTSVKTEFSFMDRIMDVLDIDNLSDQIQDFLDAFKSDDLGDLMETLFLIGLIATFFVLYRRRQRNRNRNPQPANPNPVLQPQNARPLQQPNPQPERTEPVRRENGDQSETGQQDRAPNPNSSPENNET